MRFDDMADYEPGRNCSPRHMMHFNPCTRVQSARDDVASNICAAFLNKKSVSMTWRAISARPYPVVLVYVVGCLSEERGRRAFASQGAPRALLLCAAAWLASMHAVHRRRVSRQGGYSKQALVPTVNLPVSLILRAYIRAFTLKVSRALISVPVLVLHDPPTRRHFTSMTLLHKEEGRADWVLAGAYTRSLLSAT